MCYAFPRINKEVIRCWTPGPGIFFKRSKERKVKIKKMARSVLKGSPGTLMQRALLFPLCIAVLICILSTTIGQQLFTKHVEFRSEAYMREKLYLQALIPEILEEPPAHAAEVIFVTGAMSDFGNKIAPEEVFEPPRVIRFRCEQEELFTIIMTDFDAPSRDAPYNREWLHWAVGNCEADNHLSGDSIAEFLQIRPQRATGFHRFVFYVYKQPNNTRIKFREKMSNRSEAGRNNFDTKDFARKYKLGEIYAINFFLAEWTPEDKRRPFTDPGPCWEH